VTPIALHAHNPGPMTGSGNWTWLIPGRAPTLIDAGVGELKHLDELDLALGGALLAQVIVTHAHADHADGVRAIADRMPSVRFLKIPWPDRDRRWPVQWLPLADGDTVNAGDTSLTVVHTPGHAPDHVCVWHAATRAVFGGDLAIEGATVWIPSSLGGDLADYIRSLERVIALNPARIMPAHGPVITDPIALLRGYVEHRGARERQVIDALRHGDETAASIVARVYPELDKGRLVPRAEETVIAHLVKLERDGLARRTGNAWHMIEP
jgi:glyoxylase-like metal-dependent hydrolase (beta-lactamase superfamily II)